MKPLLKWPGSKHWLVPRIAEFWDGHSRVVIPFSGSAAVELGLSPRNCLSNDINQLTSNFHRKVRAGLSFPSDWPTDKGNFLRLRAEFNALIESGDIYGSKAAQLFWYINKAGFNGLLRFNSSGFCNTPWGGDRRLPAVDAAAYMPLMDSWQITSLDFEALSLQPGDFVYADPPYDGGFSDYSSGGFTWADQIRLAEWLSGHDGQVLLSNAWTDRILDLYQSLGFECVQIEAPRFISCNGNRAKALEVLAFKPHLFTPDLSVLGDSGEILRDRLGRGRPGRAHGYTDTREVCRKSIRRGKEVSHTYRQDWYFFQVYGWKSCCYIPKGLKGKVDEAIRSGDRVEDVLNWLSPAAYRKIMVKKDGLQKS